MAFPLPLGEGASSLKIHLIAQERTALLTKSA